MIARDDLWAALRALPWPRRVPKPTWSTCGIRVDPPAAVVRLDDPVYDAVGIDSTRIRAAVAAVSAWAGRHCPNDAERLTAEARRRLFS